MELLETQDPDKKRLIEASDLHRRALEKEVSALTERTEKMLTKALIIGGSLALTYLVVSAIAGRKRKKKKAAAQAQAVASGAVPEPEEAEEQNAGPSFMSQLGNKLVDQATFMLLNLAREKLAEYLETRKSKNENS